MGNCLSARSAASQEDATAGIIVNFEEFEPQIPLEKTFTLDKELGSGAFSTVKKGIHKKTGKVFAIKCVVKEGLPASDENALREEVRVLRMLQHPKIINIFQFYQNDPKHYYVVLEYAPGGELFDRIVKKTYYDEKEARALCSVLVNAVHHMHSHDVMHRDLKPENLLMAGKSDDEVKVADFGFARSTKEGLRKTQCGTPGYVAPEILRGREYDQAVDMWSLGVIIYILLGGYPPFQDENQTKLFRKIRQGSYKFHDEYWKDISADAKDLIRSMLTVDPSRRITAAGAMQHAWLTTDRADNLPVFNLEKNLHQFKLFNAQRKLRGAIQTVIMLDRLAEMSNSKW